MPAAHAGHVILLHGIWMRGPALLALERRLRGAGFATSRFEYASVFGTPATAIARLRRQMRAQLDQPLHLLGHSLGGLLAIGACRDAEGLPVGRILCLGSPLAGSAVAREVVRWPGGSRVLGGAREVLLAGAGALPAGRDVGVIAGTLGRGLGRIAGGLSRPHDGTVAVGETRVDGLADHLQLDVSHTGMLFDARVADQAIAFLRNGRFVAGSTEHAGHGVR